MPHSPTSTPSPTSPAVSTTSPSASSPTSPAIPTTGAPPSSPTAPGDFVAGPSLMDALAQHLEARGVKATATRLLVYRALSAGHRAFSLRELDDELDTVDRSTIFRTLTLLLSHHLVHAIEDGTGVTKYEACEGHDDCSLEDQHIHFFCTRCHRTFCMHTIQIPTIQLPEGFTMQSVNYMVKGTCPNCANQPLTLKP